MLIVFVLDTSASMNQLATSGLSLLDVAKSAVDLFIKAWSHDPAHRHDRYFLLRTAARGPPPPPSPASAPLPSRAALLSGWKSSLADLLEQLKLLQAFELTDPGRALRESFDLLNTFRLLNDTDSFGRGRLPWMAEPAAVFLLHDGGVLVSESGAPDHLVLPPSISVQAVLAPEPFRWDQKFYSLTIRRAGATAGGSGSVHPPPASTSMMELVDVDAIAAASSAPRVGASSSSSSGASTSGASGTVGGVGGGAQPSSAALSDKAEDGWRETDGGDANLSAVMPLVAASGGRAYLVSGVPGTVACLRHIVTHHMSGLVSRFEVPSADVLLGAANAQQSGGAAPAVAAAAAAGGLGSGALAATPSAAGVASAATSGAPAASAAGNTPTVLVLLRPRTHVGHWPIPENFCLPYKANIFPKRAAHPRFSLAQPDGDVSAMIPPWVPVDVYDLLPCALLDSLLASAGDTYFVCAPGSHPNYPSGRPFAVLSLDLHARAAVLRVLPYDFPVLLSVLTKLKALGRPHQAWRQEFDAYLYALPPYYLPFVRNVLRHLFPTLNLVAEAVDGGLPPVLAEELRRLRQEASGEVERALLQEGTGAAQFECGHFARSRPPSILEQCVLSPETAFPVAAAAASAGLIALTGSVEARFAEISALRLAVQGRAAVAAPRHALSTAQMGDYYEAMIRRQGLRRVDEAEDAQRRSLTFGNPYARSDRSAAIVDDIDALDLSASSGGGSASKRGSGAKRKRRGGHSNHGGGGGGGESPLPLASASPPPSSPEFSSSVSPSEPGSPRVSPPASPRARRVGSEDMAVEEDGDEADGAVTVPYREYERQQGDLVSRFLLLLRKPRGEAEMLGLMGRFSQRGSAHHATLMSYCRAQAEGWKRHLLLSQWPLL